MASSSEEINCKMRVSEYSSGQMGKEGYPKFTDLESVNLVEECIALGLPIPAPLGSVVSQLITTWRNEKGYYNQRSNSDQYEQNLVALTHKRYCLGGTVDDACEYVVKEYPKTYKGGYLTPEYLKSWYQKGKHRQLKKEVEDFYGIKPDKRK